MSTFLSTHLSTTGCLFHSVLLRGVYRFLGVRETILTKIRISLFSSKVLYDILGLDGMFRRGYIISGKNCI